MRAALAPDILCMGNSVPWKLSFIFQKEAPLFISTARTINLGTAHTTTSKKIFLEEICFCEICCVKICGVFEVSVRAEQILGQSRSKYFGSIPAKFTRFVRYFICKCVLPRRVMYRVPGSLCYPIPTRLERLDRRQAMAKNSPT